MSLEFEEKVVDLYYDDYFRGEKAHDYTDEQITFATAKADIDDCLDKIKQTLYKHFDIKG